MPQDQPGQFHHAPVVFVQPVIAHLRDIGGRELNQRHLFQHRRQPAQFPPRPGGTQPGAAQPIRRRLDQPVGQNVIGELVVPHLSGQRDAEPTPQLFVKTDASPHSVQGLFLSPVAVEQAAGEGQPGLKGQGDGQKVVQRVFLVETEIFRLELYGSVPDGITSQGQNLADADLRLDEYRQVADCNGADVRAGPQPILVFRTRNGFDGLKWHYLTQ